MTVQQLIQMAERRIAFLQQSRISADNQGDAEAVSRIDDEIAQTQTTLNQLQSLN